MVIYNITLKFSHFNGPDNPTKELITKTTSFELSSNQSKLSMAMTYCRTGHKILKFINPGTPYGTYMSHVFFLHLLREYNNKTILNSRQFYFR